MVKEPNYGIAKEMHDHNYERQYVQTNPHESPLKEIFRLANIEYGRVDYSMYQGKIQVWEINTNPVILGAPKNNNPRNPVHQCFADSFNRLLTEVNQTELDPGIQVPLPRRMPKLLKS